MSNIYVEYLGTLALEGAVFSSQLNRKNSEIDWYAIENAYVASSAFNDDDSIFTNFNSYVAATESESMSIAVEGIVDMIKKGLTAIGSLFKKIANAIGNFLSKIFGNKNTKSANTSSQTTSSENAAKNQSDAQHKEKIRSMEKTNKSNAEKLSELEKTNKSNAEKLSELEKKSADLVGTKLEVASRAYMKQLSIAYHDSEQYIMYIEYSIASMRHLLPNLAKLPHAISTRDVVAKEEYESENITAEKFNETVDKIDNGLDEKDEKLKKSISLYEDYESKFYELVDNAKNNLPESVARFTVAMAVKDNIGNLQTSSTLQFDGKKIIKRCNEESEKASGLITDINRDDGDFDGKHPTIYSQKSKLMREGLQKYSQLASKMADGAKNWIKISSNITKLENNLNSLHSNYQQMPDFKDPDFHEKFNKLMNDKNTIDYF